MLNMFYPILAQEIQNILKLTDQISSERSKVLCEGAEDFLEWNRVGG